MSTSPRKTSTKPVAASPKSSPRSSAAKPTTTEKGPLRCAIYCRVSTDRQREMSTIDSQLRILPEHAKRQGWTVVDIYKDDGISGETVEDRPAFTKLLDDAEKKLFDVVLVIDLDRITRSKKSAEGALIYDLFRENKVKLATPGQGVIDLEDEDQDLLAGIKRELSKWEKRKILARTKRGKVEAAHKGKRVGSLDPFGLRWVRDNSPNGGRYDIREDEAIVVRRMYELADEDLGSSMIAWQLNHEGFKTRALKRRTRPQGGPGEWSATTVKKYLRSTTYRGEFKTSLGGGIAINVPRIIDPARWERVQAKVRQRRPESRVKHAREYLVMGLVRCGVCGAGMWAVNSRASTGSGHGQHSYYRCSSTNGWRKMRMDGPCGNKHHRVSEVDAAVWGQVTQLLRDPQLVIETTLGSAKQGVDWQGQADAAKRKLNDLEKLVAETLRRQRRGLLTSTAADKELEEIARERKMLERNVRIAADQIRDASSRVTKITAIEAQAKALAKGLTKATFEERRTLVKLLLPTEHGCGVTLHADKSIEVQGILPMPSGVFVDPLCWSWTQKHNGSKGRGKAA